MFGIRRARATPPQTPPGTLVASGMPSGPLPASDARVLLLSRTGCHLCEDAEPVVRHVCERYGASVAVIDLDQAPAPVRDAFRDHVPVTVVDGSVLSIWFADVPALEAALSGSAGAGSVRLPSDLLGLRGADSYRSGAPQPELAEIDVSDSASSGDAGPDAGGSAR